MNSAHLSEKAIHIAVRAHHGQRDKAGQPYISHPLRVMLQMTTDLERIVAVLHDVVEDTPVTLARLKRAGFPQAVLDAVDCLTKREGESYDQSIQRAKSNAIARQVKLADLEDNLDLRRLPHVTEADQRRLEKYRRSREELAREEEKAGLAAAHTPPTEKPTLVLTHIAFPIHFPQDATGRCEVDEEGNYKMQCVLFSQEWGAVKAMLTIDAVKKTLVSETPHADHSQVLSTDPYWVVENAINQAAVEVSQGSGDAARRLVGFARRSLMYLNMLTLVRQDLFRPIARMSPQWPALISWHPDSRIGTKAKPRGLGVMLKQLQVGEDCQYNVSSLVRWNINHSWATRCANTMVEIVQWNQMVMPHLIRVEQLLKKSPSTEYRMAKIPEWARRCAKVPRLSKQTVPLYFALGKAALMEATGGHPERVHELRPLGRYRANEFSKRGIGRKGTLSIGTREANIREGIFNIVKQALTSLASNTDQSLV